MKFASSSTVVGGAIAGSKNVFEGRVLVLVVDARAGREIERSASA